MPEFVEQKKQLPNPYIFKVGIKNFGSDSDLVRIIDNEFLESVRASRSDLDLMYQSWNAYFSVNNGAWEQKKLAKLRSEDRDARSYDVIGPKVDTLAGALVSELPDMDWTPVEGERTSATEAIKDSWYTDKELTNSEYELTKAIRDGLIHVGWVQLIESIKYGKPVIGLRRQLPGFFVPSAYWVQDSDRELQAAFKIAYLTPDQLKFKYKSKVQEIDDAIKIIRKHGTEELPLNAYEMRRRYVGRIADHYKVIEKHWVEYVETTRLVGAHIEKSPTTGELTGKVRWIPFPVTTDRSKLEHFASIRNIDWSTVEEAPYTDTVHHVTTVVPDLDRSIVLEDRKSKIQPKGLPFYHFTVTRYNGRNKGIVASLLDIQRTINERESLVTELISKANGGSDLIDQNIFESKDDQERLSKNANKPGYKHFVDMSQSRNGNPVVKLGANQYPSQVLDQINRMYEQILPLTSRVSDSMSAITESGKSGVLLEREYQINQVGNLLMNKGIKNFLDNIADGYFYQWQISYAGFEREVTSRDGKRRVKLNERMIDSTGKEVIRNAVGYVPRCRALVTESTNSSTYQMRYRIRYSEMLQNINPQSNPEHFNFIFNKLMDTMDLQDKDKAELEALNRMIDVRTKMSFVQQIAAIHADTKASTLNSAMADMQLAQIMAEMQNSGVGGVNQGQPAVPDQITDATTDVVEPAGPEEQVEASAGSDIGEVQ